MEFNTEIGFDYRTMLHYNQDEGVLSILYGRKEFLTEEQMKTILTLIGNCYPDSIFQEDWFIKAKCEIPLADYIKHYYTHRKGLINDIYIKIPLFIQALDGQLFLQRTEDVGLEFVFDETGKTPIYGITVYPYVYFDYTNIVRNQEVLDQRKAAEKNREILKSFLISMERIMEAEPIDVSTGHSLLEKYIYRHGIKEGAVHLI